MELTLSPEREAMLREKVASGEYATISEVIEDALRLLDERDRQQRLRAAIAADLAEIERGEDTPWTSDSMRQFIEEAGKEPSP